MVSGVLSDFDSSLRYLMKMKYCRLWAMAGCSRSLLLLQQNLGDKRKERKNEQRSL